MNERAHWSLFAFAWAAFALGHLADRGELVHGPGALLVGAAAVAVLLRPASGARMGVLAAAQLAVLWTQLPEVENHALVAVMVDAVVLVALLRHGRAGVARVYLEVAPVLRLLVLGMYGFTVLHKLNHDFLDPSVSCGARGYLELARLVPLMPLSRTAQLAAIWGTIALELALPLGLVFARTRRAALLTAVAFHGVLGLMAFHCFGTMMLALLSLFVAPGFPDAFHLWWRRSGAKVPLAGVTVGAVALVLAALAFGPAEWSGWSRALFLGFRAAAWGWSAVWLVALVTVAAPAGALTLAPGARGWWVVPLLVLANGFSPYLGLKTGTAFAMFSNLHTERGMENHVFLGPAWRVADFQDDLVTVVDSNDPALQALSGAGSTLPYFALWSRVSALAPAERAALRLSYVRGEQRFDLEGVPAGSELAEPPPWYLRKLLHFRVAGPAQRHECLH